MSTETKHTPGPWHRGSACQTGIQIITTDKNDEPNGIICEINRAYWCNKGEDGANSLLISAAPDLLSACELMKSLFDDISKSNPGFMGKLTLQDYAKYNEAMIALPAAIARAKGQ